MKTEERHETDHEHAQELIPWWVNARLSRADAARLETHFKECEECRMEAELQREVQATMRQATSIEYAPQASFLDAVVAHRGTRDGGPVRPVRIPGV